MPPGNYTKQKIIHYIEDVPLLGRILQGLKEAGLERVTIVIGYQGDNIRQEIGKNYLGLDINYVVTPNWEKGNLYSFLSAKEEFKENFILCMGDHIFDSQIVKDLINFDQKSSIVLAIDRVGYAIDDTKVLEHEGIILNIGTGINPSNGVSTGFFLCSPKLFSYAEMVVEDGKTELDECIRFVAQNRDTQVLDVSGHYWVDIDTKKDIERAKRVLTKQSQKQHKTLEF